MKEDYKKHLKDLLWCIGNQSEKVGSRLTTLIPLLFPEYTEEQRYEIRKKILGGIK